MMTWMDAVTTTPVLPLPHKARTGVSGSGAGKYCDAIQDSLIREIHSMDLCPGETAEVI
jgi:hypothetical protein